MNKNLGQAFYGDQTRWFIGVVEETRTDEPKLGRVRVRIYGIHGDREEVPISDLPQAQVLIPTTEPGVSGLGRNPILGVGATVFGIFLDGKASQLPLVLGSVPVVEVPSAEQTDNPTGPEEEKSVLDPVNKIIKTGTRTSDGNTVTIASAKVGGADTIFGDLAAGGGNDYPESLDVRRQMAWEFFSSVGYSAIATAGIVGNLEAESNLIPAAKGDIGLHSPTDVSIGIAQWYNGAGRDQILREFAAKKGKLWSDFRTQLEFVDYELKTYSYLGGSALKAATTPTQAALVFQRLYEIPELTGKASPIDGKPQRHAEAKRVANAIKVYNTFTRKSA